HRGNDRAQHLCSGERLRLCAAPPKHEGIAALKPNHIITKMGVLDKDSVDFFLSDAVASCLLPNKNPDGRRRRLFQKHRIDELIVDDHLSAAQQFQSPDREKSWISRPGADEINFPYAHKPASNASSRTFLASSPCPSRIKR